MEKVSVIMHCRNEEKYIKNCIDSIMQQAYDKETARTTGKNGRMSVEEKYNWDAQSEILLELYNSLLDK